MDVKQSQKPKNKSILSGSSQKQIKQSSKHKHIAKQGHNNPSVKLLKINSNKYDKKGSKQKTTKTLHNPEVQRVFRVHSRNKINFDQCVWSLRSLGCRLNQDNATKFQQIWNKFNKKEIDLSTFQDIYLEINSKDSQQMNSQLFEMLSQNKETVDNTTLAKMVQSSNWKGQISDIFSLFGDKERIGFEQFNKTMNLYAAMN